MKVVEPFVPLPCHDAMACVLFLLSTPLVGRCCSLQAVCTMSRLSKDTDRNSVRCRIMTVLITIHPASSGARRGVRTHGCFLDGVYLFRWTYSSHPVPIRRSAHMFSHAIARVFFANNALREGACFRNELAGQAWDRYEDM